MQILLASFYWDEENIKTHDLPKFWWTIEGPGHGGDHPYDD